jgi:hypothetical protein
VKHWVDNVYGSHWRLARLHYLTPQTDYLCGTSNDKHSQNKIRTNLKKSSGVHHHHQQQQQSVHSNFKQVS